MRTFFIFLALWGSLSGAEECKRCSPSVPQNNEYSEFQHLLNFKLKCQSQCHKGVEQNHLESFDFHQVPNKFDGNPYPDNFFSIDLNLAAQEKCQTQGEEICQSRGGLKSFRALLISSGKKERKWTWDLKKTPFGCSNAKFQPSPFDEERFSLDAERATTLIEDPDKDYMAQETAPQSTAICSPIQNKGIKFKRLASVGICAGCSNGTAPVVQTGFKFIDLECDPQEIVREWNKTHKESIKTNLNATKIYCLKTLADQVKTLAPFNKGCPGYTFDPQFCDDFIKGIEENIIPIQVPTESPAQYRNIMKKDYDWRSLLYHE